MHGQQNDKYTDMHGQQNDKYTDMHGQQNDKYTEMHGQQNVKIQPSVSALYVGHHQVVQRTYFKTTILCIKLVNYWDKI